jgi:hypothetical protein
MMGYKEEAEEALLINDSDETFDDDDTTEESNNNVFEDDFGDINTNINDILTNNLNDGFDPDDK